jgi:hypothetical protein
LLLLLLLLLAVLLQTNAAVQTSYSESGKSMSTILSNMNSGTVPGLTAARNEVSKPHIYSTTKLNPNYISCT